jgi:hypothetical protein
MTGLLNDIQALLEGSLNILALPDVDMDRLEDWRIRREAIFARLQHADFTLPREQGKEVSDMIAEVLRVDAEILSKLERTLGDLGRQVIAAGKMHDALAVNAKSCGPSLLHRTV